MNKIKKGDQVIVITGRDKGKKGEVIQVLPKEDKIIVKNINMIKKTVKKSKEYPNGAIIDIESPIHISNVMLFCQKCNKGRRVGFELTENGDKKRVGKGKNCGHKFE